MTEHARERWSDTKLEQFYQEFKQHAEDENAMVSNFLKAFPNEDPATHRMYHEAVMRAADAQEKFWQELRLDIAKKSVWGVVMLVIGLVVVGAATKLKGLIP